VYRVRSVAETIGSSARREVTLDVRVERLKFPLGIFGKSIDAGGQAKVYSQSIFSTGCVSKRKLIDFFWDGRTCLNNIPPGVHSSKIISDESEQFWTGVLGVERRYP
jgi:hypothetical protein